MGRAIVREPRAFLMDEPLSNLDAKLRVEMRAEIARIQRDLDVTTIYVTHDQVEAMTMGDRVCVIRGGSPPAGRDAAGDLRPARQPVRRRVHRLTGDEPRPGRPSTATSVRFGSNRLVVPASVLARRSGLHAYLGREIVLGVRPEDLEDASLARSDGGVTVQIDIHEDMGADVFVHFRVDAEPVETTDVLEAMEEQDVPGAVRERMRGGVPFIARLARDTRSVRAGGSSSPSTRSASTSSTPPPAPRSGLGRNGFSRAAACAAASGGTNAPQAAC